MPLIAATSRPFHGASEGSHIDAYAEQPLARHEGLIVRPAGDDVVVYDTVSNRAHALNATVHRVWTHCDGQTDVAGIRAHLEAETGAPVNEDLVWYALARLKATHLLVENDLVKTEHRRISRRAAVRMGAAGVLIPAIATLALPSRALAQAAGGSCASGQVCDAGLICCTTANQANTVAGMQNKCGFATAQIPTGGNCTLCCSNSCKSNGRCN